MEGYGRSGLRIERVRAGWRPAERSLRSSRAAVTYGILVCVLALVAVLATGLPRGPLPSPAAGIRQEAP